MVTHAFSTIHTFTLYFARSSFILISLFWQFIDNPIHNNYHNINSNFLFVMVC